MTRYIIGGLSRLSVRVSKLLLEEGDDVAVLAYPGEEDLRYLLDPKVRVGELTGDREQAMRDAGVDGAECLLALGEDDLENLRTIVAGTAAAPDVPLVLRAFDPALAEQLTRNGKLRRAYSVSALAAPAFVVAGLGGEVDETMRLGSSEVPIARLQLAPGSSLAGSTVRQVEAKFGCVVLAESLAGGGWRDVEDLDRGIAEGERIAVGGPASNVLKTAVQAAADPGVDRIPRAKRRRREIRRQLTGPLAVSVFLLVAVLLTMVAVFAVDLHVGAIHAFYVAILTAFGSGPVDPSSPTHAGLKVFAILALIASGVLVGAVFSFATAAVTEDRLQRREARRIAKLRGHAVVAGLDNVGYRLEQVLHGMGVPTVTIDSEIDPRFSTALATRTPFVQGDPRIRENLERAGLERAGLLFAVTGDELLNVEVCLQAKAVNPRIRTVARMFDEDFAGDASRTLGIDATLSTSMAAATAFASAATDEQAVRTFRLDALEMGARRLDLTRSVNASEIAEWAATGLRVLAFREHGHQVMPGTGLPATVSPGTRLIVAGPLERVRAATP
ncbi:MAG TPA: NAD-binding protein [Actinomycetota bacterium]|nr:NAD-binding protein [Actinomycetota bacterium]